MSLLINITGDNYCSTRERGQHSEIPSCVQTSVLLIYGSARWVYVMARLLLAARVSSRSQRALVVISGRCDERIVSLRTRSQPFLSQRSKNVQGRRVTRTSSEDGHLHFSCLPAFCVIVSVESRSLCTKSKYRHSRLNHHNR